MRPRTYKDAVAALNALQSNFASIEALKRQPTSPQARSELSLAEVYEYIRRLGYQPHEFNRMNVIHITGTKGKGSTAAFTDAILAQYRPQIKKVGLFTSPHLKLVRERIRINGTPLAPLKFTRYFFEVWDRLDATESDAAAFPTLGPGVKPMYFKYLTILSFHVFMLEGVDTAIYEVGVGGRYDSTNVVPRPSVAAITSLGIDHTFMLGDTIEQIAWNKAGIFKRACPAVMAAQAEYPQAEPVVRAEADAAAVASFSRVSPDLVPRAARLGLAGDFQRLNAAVAVKVAQLHLRHLGVADVDLADGLPDEFAAGLASARWDGRCQVVAPRPGYDKVTWYIDGAHTLESVRAASRWFAQARAPRGATPILLFNQQSRDNAGELLETLYDTVGVRFDHAVFTTNVTWADGTYNADLVSMNSSKDAVDRLVVQKELAERWSALDQAHRHTSRKHVFPDIETSLRFINSVAADKPVDVFVCGSLHLVGGFLAVLDGDKD